MFDWTLVVKRQIHFKTGKPFPKDKAYWDVTATKVVSYPVPPIPGALVKVDDSWQLPSLKIEEVQISQNGYTVTLELQEKFEPDYSDKDKFAYRMLDWHEARGIELLAKLLGERESDIQDDDWYLTVKELNKILTKKNWELTCYRLSVLCAAS